MHLQIIYIPHIYLMLILSFLHDKLKLTSTLYPSYQATANDDLIDKYRVNVSYTNSWSFLICHQSSETRVRICLSYDCSKYGSHVEDFNARNKCLTAELLKQGYRYQKLRKALSKFYCRHYELISKFYFGLKSVLHQGLSDNNEKFRSFKSKENIHKKEVGPYRGFGY